MKKRSKSIANILIFLGILLTLAIMGYKALSSGIHIPHISIGKIQVAGLYLRLNNKLILEIRKIDLSQVKSIQSNTESQEPMTTDKILNIVKKFLFVISYFEKLDIESLMLADGLPRSLHYDGKEYHINTPEFIARLGVEDEHQTTKLLIHQLDILGYDLLLQGSFAYRPLKKILEIDLTISPKQPTNDPEHPTLFIRGVTNFHKLQVDASSSHLYNLDSIKPYILKLRNPVLNDWLFKNIHYELLKLHSLRFQTTLDHNFFTQIQKTLALDLAIESPKIYLDPTLKPIENKRAILYMRDENLRILLKEPSFTNTKLDGSEVQLSNILTGPLGVKISIRAENAKLDHHLATLLESFDIRIPLRSMDSKLKVALDIDILPHTKDTSVLVNGTITSPQTTLLLNKQNIKVANLHMAFVNQGKKEYISLENTNIHFDNSIQGTLNAQYDLKDSQLRARFAIDKLIINSHSFSKPLALPNIPEQSDELTKRIIQTIYNESKQGLEQDIFSATQAQLPYIDFIGDFTNQQKLIQIPAFNIAINMDQNNIIECDDLGQIASYSPLLKHFGVKNGKIKISTQDFQTIYLNATLDNLTYPIYDKNNQRASKLFLSGIINDQGIYIESKDKKIMFSKEENVVKAILDGYDLRIDEFFESKIPILIQSVQEDSDETYSEEEYEEERAFIRAKQQYEREHRLSPHITYFETHNMNFYLKNYLIPSDMASISLRDGTIRADVTYGNGIANVDISHSRANLKLSNFSDEFLNRVWQKNIFSGGLFNFKGTYNNNTLRGEIYMQNTAYKDLAIVQNVLALIDTIPALLTFRKPGLGANGYEIKKGKVNLLLNSDYLVLEGIELIGSSIDVEGGGYINLKDNELNIVLKASTLKTLADIIDKIPLVNYVILGHDGKFTTGIVMQGTLDNPTTDVSVAEDILMSPFEMVGRILDPIDRLLGGGVARDAKMRSTIPTKQSKSFPNMPENLKNSQDEAQESTNETESTPQESSIEAHSKTESQEHNDDNEEVNEPNLPQEVIDDEEDSEDADDAGNT